MKIAIGADHRGFAYKKILKQHNNFADNHIKWTDVGTHSEQRTDYPTFVRKVCEAIQNNHADAGILLCGSGAGMAIAANRFPEIYACVVWNTEVARVCKEDDNVNVLVIPADFVSADDSIAMVQAWLRATFKGGRYAERLNMVD